MKWLVRIPLILVLVVMLAAGVAMLWLRSSLPQTEGTVEIPGLESPVTITRDQWGVPHIEADTERDLYRALGFVHAQDRLWQMEMNRRIAQGRLAEILGSDGLGIDKYMRTLSLSHRAESAWAGISPEGQAIITAYNEGINAYLENRSGALPVEFVVLGFEPEAFSPVDSLRWMKMMAMDLSGNMSSELARLALVSRLSAQQIAEFLPAYPGEPSFVAPDLAELYGDIDLSRLQAPKDSPEPSRGSNNWVISGDRTTTGKPFLANDPHLGLSTPSLWYLAHLKLGGSDVVGVTLPSMPGVVLGRNNRVAWGFTNTGPDIQDLFLEKLVGPGDAVLTPSGPAPIRVRREVISVKDDEPVVLEVRETPNGPILSDVIEDLRERLPEGHVLALRWTALDEQDNTIESTTRVNGVTDFDSFVTALADYKIPQQNMIFADVDGNIGYFAPGKVPVRAEDNPISGKLPVPGWDARYQWQSFIPYAELPRRYNPESGIIATANEKIVDGDYPYLISNNWAPSYRGDRIRELLRATPQHDLASMMRIQADEYSSEAADLLPLMLEAAASLDDPMLQALAQWDYVMSTDRPEPLIFATWHRELARAVYADELGDQFNRFWRQRGRFMTSVLADVDGQAHWCDDIGSDALETCEDAAVAAFEASKASLIESMAGDWRQWQWGSVHQAVQEHRPFSKVPLLQRWFESRSAIGGGSNTVDVARGTWRSGSLHEVGHAASYRAIYDLSNLENSRYVIPTGQSGNVFSPHYQDMVSLWSEGTYISIPTDIDQVAEPRQLRLVPAGGRE